MVEVSARPRTSDRSAGLADHGRWHRSRVPRVLPEHRGAYAVRSSVAAFSVASCAAFAALRGCCTVHIKADVEQRSAALRPAEL